MARQKPTEFRLKGGGTEIVYRTHGIAGPDLTYQDRHRSPMTFTMGQIRVVDAEIGQLVSVTLETVPDERTVTASILLPEINLPRAAAPSKPITFRTRVIVTTQHTSIGGPDLVDGPLQEYDGVALRGTAR